MVSPLPAKMTLCSPMTEPPLSVAKPISPRLRGPGMAVAGRAPNAPPARSRGPPPRRGRASAPCRRARPPWRGGASPAPRCRNPASSACAAWRTSTASRLTPRLILPDLTIAAWRAAAAIFSSSSAESPVVPMMWAMRACAAISAKRERRRRHGEIEHALGLGEERQRVARHRHAQFADAGQQPRHPCRSRPRPRARWRRPPSRPRFR